MIEAPSHKKDSCEGTPVKETTLRTKGLEEYAARFW